MGLAEHLRGCRIRYYLSRLCLLLLLVSCSADSRVESRATGAESADLASFSRATADDLYMEVLRLQSLGLLTDGDFQALQRALDEVDSRGETDAEREEGARTTIASFLRRRLLELSGGEHAAVVEAEAVGRGYLRQVHRAGLDAAERYAEYTLLVAGMLGVPTSQGDMVLMVGLPVGGFLLVRAKGIAARALPRLVRKLTSADEVLEHAHKRGWSCTYASTPQELRQQAGEEALRAAEAGPYHVGASDVERKRPGKVNVWNPSDRKDNCTACVASVIRNSLDGYFNVHADEMEDLIGYTGFERNFNIQASLEYIRKATGLRASKAKIQSLGSYAPVGHYAIFTRWNGTYYRHVVYGRVSPTGRVSVFDPQSMRRMTYEEFLEEYGRVAQPVLLEAARE